MRFLRAAWFTLRSLFDRSTLDDELDLELRDHIERETRANMSRGLTRAEARRAALVAFGGVQRYKEEAQDTRPARWLEDAAQDARYALRALRRTPAFAVVIVLTLALGVGATTAVFTVVNGVLLRPLPFREPDRLFVVSWLPTDLPFQPPPGLPDRVYLAYRERVRAFEQVSAYQRAQFTLSGVGDATRLAGVRVTSRFFEVLGRSPARGRAFAADDEQPGRENVAIISDKLWRQRFGGDSQIIGRTITLDGVQHTVVGVAPADFTFPSSPDIWAPLAIRLDKGNSFILSVLGRLRSGATPPQAARELASIATSLPSDPRDRGQNVAAILPLKAVVTAHIERSLLVFSAAVTFVLLIAGVNVANLLLIRAAARRQEMALRVSLGASRLRLVRQLLTESLLLSLVGAVLGVLIAFAGVHALVTLAPAGRIPRLDEVKVDGWMLGFTLALSLAAGILFGLFPALDSTRADVRPATTQGARTVAGAHSRLRGRFVAVEIALAFVLLTGAGLMIKSFVRMLSVDTGYDASGVVTMSVDLPNTSYPDAARVQQFHTALLDRLSHIPGVRAVGAVSFRPMGGMGIMGDFKVEGPTPLGSGFNVDKPTVSPGYFGAMRIRLLRGRDFSTRDDAASPGVVIVSASVARAVWPNEDAVGKRISMQDRPGPGDWLTVIGVVGDVVQDGALTPHATIYLPFLQVKSLFFINHMTYVVRTATGAAGVAPAMRAALRDVDAAVPAQALQTMNASMLEVVAEPLFQTRLLTTFSFLALLLAAIGTYGVLAYDVAERKREIGIRIALGAQSIRVLRMIVGRALLFVGTGVSAGILIALGTMRILSRFLFGVSPTDPATLATTAATLALVAVVAGLVPAQRASRVDPMEALKQD